MWAEANRIALAHSIRRFDTHGRDGSRYGHEEFTRNDRIEWMRDMLACAGVPVQDDATLLQAAIEATRYVTLRAQAPVPGAATTLRALHDHGFRLFTASGDLAENLSNYLTALGVRDLFAQTYGADLLGVGKTGPGFYAALLVHAALDPASCSAKARLPSGNYSSASGLQVSKTADTSGAVVDVRDELIDDAGHGDAYGHVLVAGFGGVCFGSVHGSLVDARRYTAACVGGAWRPTDKKVNRRRRVVTADGDHFGSNSSAVSHIAATDAQKAGIK